MSTGPLSTDESVEVVRRMLGGAIRAEMFRLHGGEFVGRLTVDPDIALAALVLGREPTDG